MYTTAQTQSRSTIFSAVAVAVLALAPQLVSADQLSDIKTRGTLVCGTLGTVPPLSFQDPNTRATVGYDIDVCNIVARALGVKSEVRIVSPAGRIAELSQGRLDVVTGTFSWTPERAKQVDFSHAYNATTTVIAVRADAGIANFDQLKGKRIASQSASTSAAAVKEKLPDASLVTFENVPQALLAFRQRRAEGVAFNKIILAKTVTEAKGTPDELVYLENPPLYIDKQGVGVKKGEPALLAAVNEALLQADKSGELTKAYDKWLGKDSEYKMAREFAVADMAY